MHLIRRARVQTRLDRPRQPHAAKRSGLLHIAQAAQELRAVGRHAVRRRAGGEEGHALAKLSVVRVARQQRMAFVRTPGSRIAAWHGA